MASKNKFKNKYETSIGAKLFKLKVPFEYEPQKLPYKIESTYLPDFKINDTLFVESKGVWKADDRRKHLIIKETYPSIIVFLCSMNPNQKIRKRSKTSYGDWCNQHSIP